MATLLGYCIQLCLYAGKDSILQGYGNIGLGLGASVVGTESGNFQWCRSPIITLSWTIILQAQLYWGTSAQWELLQHERWEQTE